MQSGYSDKVSETGLSRETMMKGQCMCGAVTFDAEPTAMEAHACHCEMCRRWTGSALISVSVKPEAVRFAGAEHIRRFQSSDWAERAWCERCGSHLYYHLTGGTPEQESYELTLGLFDAPDGFALTSEIFIDCKPAGYAFAGQRKTMTRAEVLEMFGDDES